LHQRAPEEIAAPRHPLTALPALSGILVQRDEPIAFNGVVIGCNVGVGRAGPLNDPDTAQKIDPAAMSLSVPSGPISR
jgi:hypothetical protein